MAVHDLDRSGAWYRDVLGCEFDDVDPGNWRFCRAGAVTFMLGRSPDVPAASEVGDHSYVAYLRVDDVDGFHARALTAGADVLKAPRDERWGMHELALRSPDGHRFMLGQPIESDSRRLFVSPSVADRACTSWGSTAGQGPTHGAA
jgi:catechol 2,3-dioxygenase-like lactoylglutathione lyase family enzyme